MNENALFCLNLIDTISENRKKDLMKIFDFVLSKNCIQDKEKLVSLILENNLKLAKQKGKIISNSFFIMGPKQSGKSTLLRGREKLNKYTETELESEPGLMLDIIKRAYTMSLSLVNDKDDIILLKLGVLLQIDNDVFNLIDLPGGKKKNYFDEVFIKDTLTKGIDKGGNDNKQSKKLIYVKHLNSFNEVSNEIFKSLNKRDNIIDNFDSIYSKPDHILIFHFVIEIKNKNFDTNLTLQFDFMEFNIEDNNNTVKTYDKNIETIETFIENLLCSKKYSLLEEFLLRNTQKYNFNNFFLCSSNHSSKIKDKDKDQYIQYNKLDYFKMITGRKDLIECSIEKAFSKSYYGRSLNSLILLEEIDQLNKDLEMIKEHVEENKKINYKSNNSSRIKKLCKNISMESTRLEEMLKSFSTSIK